MHSARILIANRGEIAVRIARTCRALGVPSIAVYSAADRNMPHVRAADEAVALGGDEARDSYLNIEKIIAACRQSGATAVHPGYGFLSENAAFAERLRKEGLVLIGPRPETMRAMGDKIQARRLMQERGVPVVPGFQPAEGESTPDLARFAAEAERIGYPVLIKASAGGGGRGMRLAERPEELESALESAQREAEGAFGDGTVFLEKFVLAPRHIEVQIFGDSHGNAAHLLERECSIQRRHQKIIEESPAPGLDDATRARITQAAVEAARAVAYEGAGTVEFIYSDVEKEFYFLEMNTRLQVEHPVTELVTGRDLVAEQIRVAHGAPLSFAQDEIRASGHAIEARLYAEDPQRDFLPSTGRVLLADWPAGEGVRVDAGVESDSEISIYYDPMAAKIIAHAPTREAAIARLEQALRDTVFLGPENNLGFLRAVLGHAEFRAGRATTRFIDTHLEELRAAASSGASDELALAAAGMLAWHGAENAEASIVARAPVEQRGDRAAWYANPGFRLWPA